MLQITVPATEFYNELTNEFVYSKPQILQLEHSLVSLSKWESKWEKPFLSKTERSGEEVLDYIRCMTVTQNVPAEVYESLTRENIQEIKAYIDAPMTATTFTKNAEQRREVITAEIIYYWMIMFNVPFECQKWHINRLLTLINVCSIKNQEASGKKKKVPKKDIAARNSALNAARRKQYNSTG